MVVNEMIQMRGEPFPEPLPVPAFELIALFKKHGYSFVDEGGILRLRDEYDPSRFDQIKDLLHQYSTNVNLTHSVWEVYDENDYKAAPLWMLLFPEIWISEVDFSITCEKCGKKKIVVAPGPTVDDVDSRKAVVTVNGQFTIVKDEVCVQLERELSGVVLLPFDRKKRYYHLLSEHQLSGLIMPPNQVIEYGGSCEMCLAPLFTMFFGPLRYQKREWHGEDVVRSDFLSRNVYTPKAFDLLRMSETQIVRDGIVLLE